MMTTMAESTTPTNHQDDNQDNASEVATPIKSVGQIRAMMMKGGLTEERMEQVLIDGLCAVSTYVERNGNESKVVTKPDYTLRLKYMQFITETIEGMPVKRQEIVTRSMQSVDQLNEALGRSPAMRRSLKRAIKAAEEAEELRGSGESIEA